jgi:hypothetical protein
MRLAAAARTASILVAVALALLSAACARQASSSSSPAGTGVEPRMSDAPSAGASAPPSVRASSPSSAIASPHGTGAPAWVEQTRAHAEADTLLLVDDAVAWSGGMIASGRIHSGANTTEGSELAVWSAPGGQGWLWAPAPAATDVMNSELAAPPAGGVLLIATVDALDGEGRTVAWRSADGMAWTEVVVPGEWAEGNATAASGRVGILVVVANVAWFSADGVSWDVVLEPPTGVTLSAPGAGDEGFVIPASDEYERFTYASGDGLSWVEGSPANAPHAAAPWRGDWFGWVHTADPATISVVRSSNGLDWTPVLDVSGLVDPDGPQAAQGLGEITEAHIEGAGDVLALTLGFNHCCAMPPRGMYVFISTDGETWTDAGLSESAYITAIATDGDSANLAGHLERGAGGVSFWVADR